MTSIRVGHLYPDYLNIYADRGNIAVLARRAAWRGHELMVSALGMGEGVAPGDHDLYYVGGGQDREQLLVAEDLAGKSEALHEAVAGSQPGPVHLAMALCRPGPPAVLPDDAVWAEGLREKVGAHVDGTWSLHLAAGGSVLPIVNPPLWAWS